jgi:hypothetical protein
MNESTKTLTFLAVAVGLIVAAFATAPRPVGITPEKDTGQPFFPDFKDPLAARSLDIMEFDEDLAALKPFKVAEVKGIWTIPSHEGYPADADKQLAEAAASLMDLKKLSYVSDDKGDQELYGVVDPTSKDLSAGATGVGKKVVIEDDKGKILAQFIIGKADDKQPDVRYVRIPGQDRIYRTEIKTDKLSTDFDDWIEKDLLKMNPLDFERLTIDDHMVDIVQGAIAMRGEMIFDFDNKDSKWSVVAMKRLTKQGLVDEPLAADEELNTQKLNELKTALDDLKIIDVSRKPAGVSADLRADKDLAKDAKARASLQAHGFHFAQVNGKLELYSNEGDIIAGMNDGVEYVIRFGEIAGRDKEKKDGDAKTDGDKKDDEEKSDEGGGTSRYVLVTTRFNKELIAKPELKPLPEPGAAKPEDSKPEDEKPATEPKADEAPTDKDGLPGNCQDTSAADEAKDDEKKADEPKADAKAPPVDPERARIERENKRKQDEYDDKVKAGEKRVKELNERFADWYYVISDATYRKIHLTRADLVKKKEPADDEKKADAKADGPINIPGLPSSPMP